MPSTSNYSWPIPTEGGDSGTWDTILNGSTFLQIDRDVKKVEKANTLTSITRNTLASSGTGTGWRTGYNSSTVMLSRDQTTNPSTDAANVALPFLRKGMRITKFRTFGTAQSGASCTASLQYVTNSTGAETQVSAGHALGSSIAEQETTGLTHDVDDNRTYYAKFAPSGSAGSIGVVTISVTIEPSP